MQFLINTLISALVIAGTVEIANRSSLLSALLVSLPLTSILAISLLYFKTNDIPKVIELSYGIFWLVLPSLGLFLVLPLLLKYGFNFWLSLAVSCLALGICYLVYASVLRRFGVFLT